MLDLELILIAVQGFEESLVTVRIQEAFTAEPGKYVALEIVAMPVVEDLRFEYEEARVDPVTFEQRFLAKRAHTPGTIEMQRSVLRHQRDRGDRRQAIVRPMKAEQVVDRNVAETIGVGGHECTIQRFPAFQNTPPRVSLGTRVDAPDSTSQVLAVKIIRYDVLAVTDGKDEIGMPLVHVDLHDMHQNG